MDDTKTNKFVFVKVKTSCRDFRINFDRESNLYLCSLKSQAIEGKANEELVKLFKKALKMKVEIVSGHTAKIKKLKVL